MCVCVCVCVCVCMGGGGGERVCSTPRVVVCIVQSFPAVQAYFILLMQWPFGYLRFAKCIPFECD